MSSAILYLAIIAIWACVLIPRWLRRDSARGAAAAQTPAQASAPPVDAGHAAHADPVPGETGDAADDAPRQEAAPAAGRQARRRHGGACSPPAAACC